MRILFTSVILVLLTGCSADESIPPEKLTLQTVRNNAQHSLVQGVELGKFERINGWADPNGANTYKVRYHFYMVLKDDLPQVALSLAQNNENRIKGNQLVFTKKKIRDMDPAALDYLQLIMTGNNWVNSQTDFSKRRDEFLSKCLPCIEYWNDTNGGKDAIELRRFSYIQAWSHLESMGFDDKKRKGDGAIWNATPTFMKTEKGWVEAS